jgi:hypothetical protein
LVPSNHCAVMPPKKLSSSSVREAHGRSLVCRSLPSRTVELCSFSLKFRRWKRVFSHQRTRRHIFHSWSILAVCLILAWVYLTRCKPPLWGFTGNHSNQNSKNTSAANACISRLKSQWRITDLNRWPSGCQIDCLPFHCICF